MPQYPRSDHLTNRPDYCFRRDAKATGEEQTNKRLLRAEHPTTLLLAKLASLHDMLRTAFGNTLALEGKFQRAASPGGKIAQMPAMGPEGPRATQVDAA